MENALVRFHAHVTDLSWSVLILVLMENALVLEEVSKMAIKGLNPCFNGKCTRTKSELVPETKGEKSLNPCFNGKCTRTRYEHLSQILPQCCLNPCFNGKCTRTIVEQITATTANES